MPATLRPEALGEADACAAILNTSAAHARMAQPSIVRLPPRSRRASHRRVSGRRGVQSSPRTAIVRSAAGCRVCRIGRCRSDRRFCCREWHPSVDSSLVRVYRGHHRDSHAQTSPSKPHWKHSRRIDGGGLFRIDVFGFILRSCAALRVEFRRAYPPPTRGVAFSPLRLGLPGHLSEWAVGGGSGGGCQSCCSRLSCFSRHATLSLSSCFPAPSRSSGLHARIIQAGGVFRSLFSTLWTIDLPLVIGRCGHKRVLPESSG
jgi:hypothetical protein